MLDSPELPITTGVEVHFNESNISELPENVDLPGLSSWSQKFLFTGKTCKYSIVRMNNGEEISAFYGAPIYIQIKGKGDLLDVYFVRGNELEPDALAFYNGAHNNIMLQEATWGAIRPEALSKFKKEIADYPDTSNWVDLLRKQSDEVLSAYLMFGFQTTVLHEIAHRFHFGMEPENQRALHSKFVHAASVDRDLQNAVNEFTKELYDSDTYLNSHAKRANQPMVRFSDQYWRRTGIYDPRTLTISVNGSKREVALASHLTEVFAYLSGRVLLAYMVKNQAKCGEELNELFALAPSDGLTKRVLAIRELFKTLSNGRYFNISDLYELYPADVISSVVNSTDKHTNVAWYLMKKTKHITFDRRHKTEDSTNVLDPSDNAFKL